MVKTTLQVIDPVTKKERPLIVLSPPGEVEKSVTIYFQDGGDYLNQTGVEHLLANISGRDGMPSLTAVFIPPLDRTKEYAYSDDYVAFLVNTVVSTIENKFPTTGGNAQSRLLMGPSLGGMITFYAALRNPEVFGNAASESGSFWYESDTILSLLRKRGASAPKLYADVGTYETTGMIEGNRKVAEVGKEAGCKILLREYPSTHSWIAWRNRLGIIFNHFFSKK